MIPTTMKSWGAILSCARKETLPAPQSGRMTLRTAMSDTFDPAAAVRANAEALAECALAVVQRHYPHKLDHLILDEHDHALPQDIHPVFSGCYDWHSSVHMHWSLLRLRAMVPNLSLQPAIDAHVDLHVTDAKVERERAYAATPGRGSFERPYGWAWLLKLQSELETQAAGDAHVARWAGALRPFAADIARRFADFLGRSHYPVRAGTHASSAFAMLLAWDHATRCNDAGLRQAIESAAQAWFGADRQYPAAYEPSGADFLSPGLCEALLMQRVLAGRFDTWWSAFAPPADALARWLTPAVVSDRTDPQLVHLDGLNLSRAWCLGALGPSMPAPLDASFRRAAAAHWASAWPHVTMGDFAATHWLVSFALLSLDAAAPPSPRQRAASST